MKYDLFISHASEDKQPFADRLAHALRKDGYKVWYDEFVLQPGRSLRRSIDEGLTESAVGVVILSPNFFRKEWALRELDALTSQQIYEQKLLIPIWLNVTRDDVARQSPLLVDRIAIPAVKGFDYLLSELKMQINAADKLTDRELDEIVRHFFDSNRKRAAEAHGEALARGRRCARHFEHTTRVYRRSRWTGQRGETRLSRFGSL